MCGIFACRPPNEDWLDNSISLHKNRGPDQNAKIIFSDFGVTINRLAITGNFKNGAQPVWSNSGNTSCVFNGAIFNAEELVQEFP